MAGKSVNRVTLLGRIGQDPKFSYTGSNKAVMRVDVATSESWKDKSTGEWKENTEWHSVVIWGRLAEAVSQHFKKGMEIYVEGKQKTREWEKDGIKRKTTEVIVDQDGTAFLTGNRVATQGNAQAAGVGDEPPFNPDDYPNAQ